MGKKIPHYGNNLSMRHGYFIVEISPKEKRDCSRSVESFSPQLLTPNAIKKNNRLYRILILLYLAEQRPAFRQDLHPASLYLEFISIIYHPIPVPEPKLCYCLTLIEV